MKKNIEQLFTLLHKRFTEDNFTVIFDEKASSARVEFVDEEGVTISLPPLLAKWERIGDKAIDEVVYYIKETSKAKKQKLTNNSDLWKVIPVIRSTSFPKENNSGQKYISFEHTAETSIYIAIDQGNTYRLITEEDCKQASVTVEHLYERALFALNGLPTTYKTDAVAGNSFYFINTKDGYDSSRMLNKQLMDTFKKDCKGEMVVAIPHADVCIIGDIQNDVGYDVIAQMAMGFFMNGNIPITALSFVYDKGEFEPLFILGKKKRT